MSEPGRFSGDLALALALHRAGDLTNAADAYLAMITGYGDQLAPLANLAAILRLQGDGAGAERYLRRALAVAPGTPGLNRNLGNLLYDWARTEEAAAAYRNELSARPEDTEAQMGLARACLANGDFGEGFGWLEDRPERAAAVARGLTGREWRGEPLDGKRLLIWPEQGFGDQMLMARFVPRLAGDVTMVVFPQLARLFADLPAAQVMHAETVALPDHDYWTLPMSLPFCLGVSGADLATKPYLRAAPARTGGVGVMWLGNAMPDPGRSLPPDLGAELLALPGAVSLAPEDTGARDFRDTAELIAGLDLVVSVDTAVAHLAGAMGRPTLVLQQARPPEWRWRTDADGRAVWYPSARVIRQPTQGDWRSVVDQVKPVVAHQFSPGTGETS